MNPFESMTYAGCANPKKEKFQPQGKYEYDVFYTLDGEIMTGHTKGDNQKHARENFYENMKKGQRFNTFKDTLYCNC